MHICNLSFYTGIVPEQIKIARLVLVYKHGDPSQFNTLKPRQNGRHFADDILKCIFFIENILNSIHISLNCLPKGQINNIPALIQIMAWRRPGDKPLSEPMMISLLTHICFTRPQLVNNYRPVSVLNVFSKVYERLSYNRLFKYLNKHKILYELQFGYREKHSTELAHIYLIEKMISERNEFTIAVYLDLSKAFDMVDHQISLKKLEHYGIRGVPLKWLSSYLSDRQQYVNFQNTDSDKMFIKHGVT